MYEEYYKFSGKPFQLSPDPGFFFKSKGHQRAMAYLRYGLQQGDGFIVITGDVGTGKTMLVNNLFRDIDSDKIVAAKIVSTNLKDGDFIEMLASRFGLETEGVSKGNLVKELEKFLITCHEAGQRALCVVDEAQNLPVKSLEELRMLSNFEIDHMPLLQSFLLGQREFRATLRSPGLEQLKQRVIAAYHLKSLSDLETREYIQHRLQKVGWDEHPRIEDDVYLGIYRFTRGIPRRINTLMDRLLLNASLDKQDTISLDALNAIIKEIQSEQNNSDEFDDDAFDQAVAATSVPQTTEAQNELVTDDWMKSTDANIKNLEHQLAGIQNSLQLISQRMVNDRMSVDPPIDERPQPSSGDFAKGMLLSATVSIAVAAVFIVGYLVYRSA